MHNYSLTHVRDEVLLRNTNALIVEERGAMAFLLAHLAEIDTRKLYAPLGYSSMFAFCVEELRFSEDVAAKRIHAARACRRFPILFTELAEGRLHLTAVLVLAPHLTEEIVGDVVRASSHRRQSEIEDILRVCAPGAQGELAPEPGLGLETAGVADSTEGQHAVQHVEDRGSEGLNSGRHAVQHVGDPGSEGVNSGQHAVQHVGGPDLAGLAPVQHAVQHVATGSLSSQVEQLVPLMVRQEIKDRVRYMQALLSHALPSGDVSKLLARALDLLADEVEKRRFGTGNGSRRRRTGARNRYIPAAVRHAVWNRDEGRCTFMGENGHRCNSDMYLEFDHVDPRNRQDTVAGLRLRCKTHNQYEAERVFGTEFMKQKREEARLAAEKRRAEKARTEEEREKEREKARAQAAENAELEDQIQDVLSALRGLGIRGDHAKRAAERARSLEGAGLAERIRAALEFHGECVMQSPKARAVSASG